MPTVLIILGLFAAVIAFVVAQTTVMMWRLKRLPPPAPILCPKCGSAEHTYDSQGLWDGRRDPKTGDRPHGVFFYGTCKECGSRIAKWDDDAAYVPSNDEWQREVTSLASGGTSAE
jgi:hypothetical protein